VPAGDEETAHGLADQSIVLDQQECSGLGVQASVRFRASNQLAVGNLTFKCYFTWRRKCGSDAIPPLPEQSAGGPAVQEAKP
jgi:hypothetical protein